MNLTKSKIRNLIKEEITKLIENQVGLGLSHNFSNEELYSHTLKFVSENPIISIGTPEHEKAKGLLKILSNRVIQSVRDDYTTTPEDTEHMRRMQGKLKMVKSALRQAMGEEEDLKLKSWRQGRRDDFRRQSQQFDAMGIDKYSSERPYYIRKGIRESALLKESEHSKNLIDLILSGNLASAEMLASSLEPPIDLFPIIASDYRALKYILSGLINDKVLEDYLYMVGDGSFYEQAFFPTLMRTLPNFPELCAGMSYDEIVGLMNSDPENYQHYSDAEMSLGMSYPAMISASGQPTYSMSAIVKEWLIGILFLKMESLHSRQPGLEISEIIASLQVT